MYNILDVEDLKKEQLRKSEQGFEDFCELLKFSFISQNFDKLKLMYIENRHNSSKKFFTKKKFLEDIKILVSSEKMKVFKKIKKETLLNEFLKDWGYHKNGLPVFDYYYNLEKIIKININDLKKLI